MISIYTGWLEILSRNYVASVHSWFGQPQLWEDETEEHAICHLVLPVFLISTVCCWSSDSMEGPFFFSFPASNFVSSLGVKNKRQQNPPHSVTTDSLMLAASLNSELRLASSRSVRFKYCPFFLGAIPATKWAHVLSPLLEAILPSRTFSL